MPRHTWMKELVGDISDNIGTIFEYAKNNFRNDNVYKKIEDISNILKTNLIYENNILTKKKTII